MKSNILRLKMEAILAAGILGIRILGWRIPPSQDLPKMLKIKLEYLIELLERTSK